MGRLERGFDNIIPDYHRLRHDANVNMRTVEVDPGRLVEIPFYDQDIAAPVKIYERPFITKGAKRDLGIQAVYSVAVDGIAYEAAIKVAHDEFRNEHEYLTAGSSAWMLKATGGILADTSARLFARTLQPSVDIGPPGSGVGSGIFSSIRQLPTSLHKAHALPLSYIAQAEQGIIGAIKTARPDFSLPTAQVKVGKSRGAIESAGHSPHADIFAFDNQGRTALDHITLEQVPTFLEWLMMTGLGGTMASICLFKAGKIKSLAGSTSLSLDFLSANISGTARALGSGEGRAMMEMVPRSMHGKDVLYGRDTLSDANDIKETWQPNQLVDVSIAKNGTHGALLHPAADNGFLERMDRLNAEYQKHCATVEAMNWKYIHAVKEVDPLQHIAA